MAITENRIRAAAFGVDACKMEGKEDNILVPAAILAVSFKKLRREKNKSVI
jgi:hypothetical protein